MGTAGTTRDDSRGARLKIALRRGLLWLAAWNLAVLALARSLDFPFAATWAWTLNVLLAGWIIFRALGLHETARIRRRLLGLGLEDLDRLDGASFETWVRLRLEHGGLSVRQTPRGGDFGVDLLVRAEGRLVGIEVKRRQGRVGNDVVRSVLAGARFHGCHAAAVVTQAGITREAHRQAAGADLPIALIGREALATLDEELRALARRTGEEQRQQATG